METVVVTEYGGRAEAIEMPAPDAHAGQVLIKVHAAGVQTATSAAVSPTCGSARAIS